MCEMKKATGQRLCSTPQGKEVRWANSKRNSVDSVQVEVWQGGGQSRNGAQELIREGKDGAFFRSALQPMRSGRTRRNAPGSQDYIQLHVLSILTPPAPEPCS